MVAVFAAIVSIAAFVWTLHVRTKDIPEPIPVSPVQHLEDRKQAIYENLRDLQFEYRLGKLSDEDYQQTKQPLQRELGIVLAETEATMKSLGLMPQRVPPRPSPQRPTGTICPHCGAKFPQALKYCGE